MCYHDSPRQDDIVEVCVLYQGRQEMNMDTIIQLYTMYFNLYIVAFLGLLLWFRSRQYRRSKWPDLSSILSAPIVAVPAVTYIWCRLCAHLCNSWPTNNSLHHPNLPHRSTAVTDNPEPTKLWPKLARKCSLQGLKLLKYSGATSTNSSPQKNHTCGLIKQRVRFSPMTHARPPVCLPFRPCLPPYANQV